MGIEQLNILSLIWLRLSRTTKTRLNRDKGWKSELGCNYSIFSRSVWGRRSFLFFGAFLASLCILSINAFAAHPKCKPGPNLPGKLNPGGNLSYSKCGKKYRISTDFKVDLPKEYLVRLLHSPRVLRMLLLSVPFNKSIELILGDQGYDIVGTLGRVNEFEGVRDLSGQLHFTSDGFEIDLTQYTQTNVRIRAIGDGVVRIRIELQYLGVASYYARLRSDAFKFGGMAKLMLIFEEALVWISSNAANLEALQSHLCDELVQDIYEKKIYYCDRL